MLERKAAPAHRRADVLAALPFAPISLPEGAQAFVMDWRTRDAFERLADALIAFLDAIDGDPDRETDDWPEDGDADEDDDPLEDDGLAS